MMSKFNTKEAHPASLEWKKKKTVSTALASQKAQFFIKNVLKARKKKMKTTMKNMVCFPVQELVRELAFQMSALPASIFLTQK